MELVIAIFTSFLLNFSNSSYKYEALIMKTCFKRMSATKERFCSLFSASIACYMPECNTSFLDQNLQAGSLTGRFEFNVYENNKARFSRDQTLTGNISKNHKCNIFIKT